MIRFLGGKKKGRNSVNAAVEAIMREPSGETGIYDEETGKVYTVDGVSATIVPNPSLAKIIDLLSVMLLRGANPLAEEEILATLQQAGEPFFGNTVDLTKKRLAAQPPKQR